MNDITTAPPSSTARLDEWRALLRSADQAVIHSGAYRHADAAAMWDALGNACDALDARATVAGADRPTIVCLCGSTRFGQAFRDANLRETLAGRIVLSIGCDMRSDDDVFGAMSVDERAATKADLDRLHLDKVALADEVLILNVGGYIGESTGRELAHARDLGKGVRFLEPAP